MLNFGLKKLPKDSRDFQLGWITKLPKLSELPEEYKVTLNVKNQLESDFCTAYATCYMSEAQEDVELEPSWSFAVSKSISGNVDQWGQDMRSAMKSHLRGALPKKGAPYSLDRQHPGFLRDLNNWPDLLEKTRHYRKKSYFKITGPYDYFDNIRASIWKFKDKKRLASLGLLWGYTLNQRVLEKPTTRGYGHAVAVVGWKYIDNIPYLIIINQYGEEAGDRGYHYVSREVVNKWAEEYGSYMFVDINPNDIKNSYWSWWTKLINFIKNVLHI